MTDHGNFVSYLCGRCDTWHTCGKHSKPGCKRRHPGLCFATEEEAVAAHLAMFEKLQEDVRRQREREQQGTPSVTGGPAYESRSQGRRVIRKSEPMGG